MFLHESEKKKFLFTTGQTGEFKVRGSTIRSGYFPAKQEFQSLYFQVDLTSAY